MKYVTFSFDDGFKESTIKTVKIFESFHLIAEFNVVAKFSIEETAHADFGLLNELQENGHVIQPHGYSHIDKGICEYSEAVESIEKCIEIFTDNLTLFQPENSIFCFPYNSSNEKIEQYVSKRFRAFRTGYDKVLNNIPDCTTKMIYGDGWPDVQNNIENSIQKLLNMEDGWLVYNVHGLDGEGWEPITSDYLSKTLDRLLRCHDVKILPMIKVLEENCLT